MLDLKKLLTKILTAINRSTSGSVYLPDGTLVEWGNTYIDVTSGTGDRKQIPTSNFVGSPHITLTVIENAYNYQPVLFVWNTGNDYYALNKATKPSRHVQFNYLAIGKWK